MIFWKWIKAIFLHVIFEYYIFFENPNILSIGSGSIWLTFMKSPNGSLWIIMDQNIILSWSTCKGPYNFLRNFGTPAKNIPQKLKNRMVKTVFENSKFLPSKITCKNFYLFIRPWGQKILQAIFDGKNFEFSKTVFTIRFWRLWRMFLSRVQKFSEILKYFLWSLWKA